MALTVTTLINGTTFAAATSVIASTPAATALQATSASLTLFGKVSSPGVQAATKRIILWWAVIPYDSTDGIAAQCAKCANRLELKWGDKPGQVVVTTGLPTAAGAGYIHTWLEIPNLPFAATVTVTLVESPIALVQNDNFPG